MKNYRIILDLGRDIDWDAHLSGDLSNLDHIITYLQDTPGVEKVKTEVVED
jgi:hypothetical protein